MSRVANPINSESAISHLPLAGMPIIHCDRFRFTGPQTGPYYAKQRESEYALHNLVAELDCNLILPLGPLLVQHTVTTVLAANLVTAL